jgi:hypothetical protein
MLKMPWLDLANIAKMFAECPPSACEMIPTDCYADYSHLLACEMTHNDQCQHDPSACLKCSPLACEMTRIWCLLFHQNSVSQRKQHYSQSKMIPQLEYMQTVEMEASNKYLESTRNTR